MFFACFAAFAVQAVAHGLDRHACGRHPEASVGWRVERVLSMSSLTSASAGAFAGALVLSVVVALLVWAFIDRGRSKEPPDDSPSDLPDQQQTDARAGSRD